MNPNNPKNKWYNQELILIALSDGQWHRNMELKEKTKLTPRTLSKHLKELEKELHWIERREDTESGEYPHPVLYRVNRSCLSYAIYINCVFHNADSIETELKETKDPFNILEEFNELNEYYFALILETIQEKKHITQKELDFMTNIFFFSPYEIYTKEIITAFTEAVQFGAQFNINQLRRNHNVWDGTPEINQHEQNHR